MAILPLPIPFFSFCVESCALITGLRVMSLPWRLLPLTRHLPIPLVHVHTHTCPATPRTYPRLTPELPATPLPGLELLPPTPPHGCLETAGDHIWLFVLRRRLFNFPAQAADKELYSCFNKNELVPKGKGNRKKAGLHTCVVFIPTHVFKVQKGAMTISISHCG